MSPLLCAWLATLLLLVVQMTTTSVVGVDAANPFNCTFPSNFTVDTSITYDKRVSKVHVVNVGLLTYMHTVNGTNVLTYPYTHAGDTFITNGATSSLYKWNETDHTPLSGCLKGKCCSGQTPNAHRNPHCGCGGLGNGGDITPFMFLKKAMDGPPQRVKSCTVKRNGVEVKGKAVESNVWFQGGNIVYCVVGTLKEKGGKVLEAGQGEMKTEEKVMTMKGQTMEQGQVVEKMTKIKAKQARRFVELNEVKATAATTPAQRPLCDIGWFSFSAYRVTFVSEVSLTIDQKLVTLPPDKDCQCPVCTHGWC